MNIYKGPYGITNLEYSVGFGSATEMNQTRGHHCNDTV